MGLVVEVKGFRGRVQLSFDFWALSAPPSQQPPTHPSTYQMPIKGGFWERYWWIWILNTIHHTPNRIQIFRVSHLPKFWPVMVMCWYVGISNPRIHIKWWGLLSCEKLHSAFPNWICVARQDLLRQSKLKFNLWSTFQLRMAGKPTCNFLLLFFLLPFL